MTGPPGPGKRTQGELPVWGKATKLCVTMHAIPASVWCLRAGSPAYVDQGQVRVGWVMSLKLQETQKLYQEIADLSSALVGDEDRPLGIGIVRDLHAFRVIVRDHFDSEVDAHGYRETMTRQIEISADRVRLQVSKVIQGFDEFDGGGYSDSRVEILSESSWRVTQAVGEWEDLAVIRDQLADLLAGP